MATVVETKPVTAEEYALMADPPGGRLELIRGEVIVVPPPNWEHGEVQGNIAYLIKHFLRSNPLGRVAVEGGVITDRGPDTVRGPDVSFISKERLPLGVRLNRYADQVPDLCVEVVSPSNTRSKLNEKVKEYFFGGCRMVWVVDPDERSVNVYCEPLAGRVLKDGAILDGEDVLPGFSCKVADLFA